MHLSTLRIRNFRRLKDVRIDLANDISIFVGANNSGKTSATHAIQLFMSASRERFSVYDFNADLWADIESFGEQTAGAVLPAISLDMWFKVNAENLHRVVDLLPSLTWEGSLVGIRIEFCAIDQAALLTNFRAARDLALAKAHPGLDEKLDYCPFPRNLREYLKNNLNREYHLQYYVLDSTKFDTDFVPVPAYTPLLVSGDQNRTGRDILNSLINIDFLHAQRHLSDSTGGSRVEDLSRCLSRFYERNLEKRENDYETLRALADSEEMLSRHLQEVFEPTLKRLASLGYPGLTNPRLLIRSALNPTVLLGSSDGAKVHYALNEDANPISLPDRYNGLGFKNLIYMVVELLDLHAQWMDSEDERPPLHLIFIEEPEAHLHAQLQQAFIRKVLDILALAHLIHR